MILARKIMTLDLLPLRTAAIVSAIDWAAMPDHEAHRLRALGLDVGVEVEPMHRGILFWRDPVSVRIGRMTVAMRRRHTAAIETGALPA